MIIAKNNLIIIRGYKEIKVMSSKLIVFYIGEDIYKIQGEHLRMIYYDRFEIRISGTIKVISYGI